MVLGTERDTGSLLSWDRTTLGDTLVGTTTWEIVETVRHRSRSLSRVIQPWGHGQQIPARRSVPVAGLGGRWGISASWAGGHHRVPLLAFHRA